MTTYRAVRLTKRHWKILLNSGLLVNLPEIDLPSLSKCFCQGSYSLDVNCVTWTISTVLRVQSTLLNIILTVFKMLKNVSGKQLTHCLRGLINKLIAVKSAQTRLLLWNCWLWKGLLNFLLTHLDKTSQASVPSNIDYCLKKKPRPLRKWNKRRWVTLRVSLVRNTQLLLPLRHSIRQPQLRGTFP